MPQSEFEGKKWIFEQYYYLSNMLHIRSVLDIGVGCGTYANLLRDCRKDTHWTGVEVWAPYITEFNLEQRYDEVVVADIRYLDFNRIRRPDCVIAGDVLEHMSQQDAVGVLNNLVNLARFVVVSVPIVHMPQGAWGGNPFEEHVEDSYSHERLMRILPHVQDFSRGQRIGSYILSSDALVCKLMKELPKAA